MFLVGFGDFEYCLGDQFLPTDSFSPPMISPLVGKKDTVSKMGIEIPHRPQPVGKKDTVSQNGIVIPHQAPLVGKKDTVSQNGIDTPHQWG